MSEHLDSHELKLFIARQLAPAELLRTATHMSGCQSCRERLSLAERTGLRIENLRTELRRDVKPVEQHLDYAQLEAYVDDTLGAVGRAIADNHLAICSSCTREAQELEPFREDLMHPNHASKTMVPLAANLPADVRVEQHLWQRFRDSLRLSPQIAWAAAAALLITIAAGLLLWQRGKVPEVANDNRSNAPEVVKNNSGNPTVVVSNANVNVNSSSSAPGSDSTNRHDSINARRRETAGPASNVDRGVGVSTYAAVIKRALETKRLDPAPVLKELAGKPSTLMNGSQSDDLALGPEGATFSLFQPVGTVTLSDRPNFSWRPLPGATSYQVHVLDTDFKVVAESGSITATSWSPATALDRGSVYLWQVSAVKEGKVITAPAVPQPEARFKILTGSKTREVQQAVKTRADSHLAQGIIYAHTGLLDDAEREFQDALSRPHETAIARKLLRKLSALRR